MGKTLAEFSAEALEEQFSTVVDRKRCCVKLKSLERGVVLKGGTAPPHENTVYKYPYLGRTSSFEQP